MTTAPKPRAPGWYWVRTDPRYALEPAEWNSRLEWWVLLGNRPACRDDYLYEIGPRILSLDEHQIMRDPAPTEAQRREIAEAWKELSERYWFVPDTTSPSTRRMIDALRAAGLLEDSPKPAPTRDRSDSHGGPG
jgi:hypothetical protein